MIVLKIIIIVIFGIVLWQDYKERMVHWFLYPFIGVLGFYIQKSQIDYTTLFMNSLVNITLVTTILIVLYIYSKLILKKKLINESIGIGDVLLFFSLCFCFSIISFLVLFVFSLVFSLFVHFIISQKKTGFKTIPLAGYMSLFFGSVYGASLFFNCNFLFAY